MDLSRTREIFERPGPFATVYLEARQAEEDSAKQMELRWRDLRGQLVDAGADDKTLAALDDELAEVRPGSLTEVGRVLVASAEGVLFDDAIEAVTEHGDVATWSPLPELGNYYRMQVGTTRTLLVIADQTGGDVYQLTASYDEGAREVGEQHVQGSSLESVHKPREGGNAHKQRQRRHEMAAYENADELVAAVRTAASSFRPQVIVLAGEVQGRQVVAAEMPGELSAITREIDAGSRAAGASEQALEDELLRVAGAVATEEEGRVREQLREGKAHATAVEGFEPVLEAARTGAVATLVLVSGADVPGELYVGGTPELLSTDAENLTALSDVAPVARPSEQALLRAVGAMGGDISVLGSGVELADNVGALLRFPTGS